MPHLDAGDADAADVIGFSDGAINGLLLARDHPLRVRAPLRISTTRRLSVDMHASVLRADLPKGSVTTYVLPG